MFKRVLAFILIGALIGLPVPPGYAQAPVAGDGPPPAPLSAAQLEELVGRIALYPDDLVAIILPASTFPLDVVQADRFLQKLKQDKNLKPDERWDESIRNLLNYPEVIGMMSQDLDWTQDLGEAVVSQQGDVLKAVQAFREKASAAGNLKSDDKQIVVQENNVIQIVPADPQVIYVPQYQPQTVVVYQAAPPPPVYYPTPYPVYYYPYPPGAAFATGFFFGAATAWAVGWGGRAVYRGVRYDEIQDDRRDMQSQRQSAASDRQSQRQDSASQRQTQRQDQQTQRQDAAQGGRQQGQGGGQAGQQPRPGGGQAGQQPRQGGGGPTGGSQWQSQKKPGDVSQGRVSAGTRESRPGYGSGGSSRGDSFGGGGRGSDATRDSNRGAQSRGGGAGVSTADRGGSSPGGGGSRGSGGAGVSTADRGGGGGSRSGGGGASMGSGGSRGGSSSGSRGGGGGGRRR
jgi:hypothetical protein